jgi:drug/metabolite transporter (DMT)-like permease
MGILVTIFSALCSTAKDIVSKGLASRVHSDVSTFASFLFALPFYALIVVVATLLGLEPLAFSGSFFWLVLARSVTDVFAESLKMKAFASGDLSLVSTFLSLSPIFLAILSPFTTGDNVTVIDLLALGLIVAGGLLLIQRDASTGKVFQLKAVLFALAASVAFALNSCFDRLAVMESGPIVSGLAMTLLAALFTLPLAFRHHGAGHALSLNSSSFLVRGAFEALFMVSKLFALTMLPAHVVVGGTRVSLIVSVIAGRLWFGERNTLRRFIAALCVYAGLLILVLEHV